jgi:DNA invertase Pin-like site-specific DNA recombinase
LHGQRIGYVRVSSFDQNPERQLEQIQVDKVFTDKASGKDTRRPELERLLAFVREGDTVVVHSMDRLARNLDDLRRLVQGLTQRGVRIEFLKEHLTFTGEDSPMANLMLSVSVRRVRTRLDPRAAARGHRARQAARGLPWQEEIPVV